MSKNNADLLRARLRTQREAIPVAKRQQDSAQLCQTLIRWFDARAIAQQSSPRMMGQTPSEIVAGFWPLEHEPDIRPVLFNLYARGITIALPLVVKKNTPLAFHAWHPQDTLRPGAFGVLEPTGETLSRPLQPTVLLVPTLGFTPEAARLGYGGGYYDRTLAQLREQSVPFTTIGIAWNQARLDRDSEHRVQPHDYPLEAILTPGGWHPAMPLA